MNSKTPNKRTNGKKTNLRVEQLEDRRLMAVMHVTNVMDNGDNAHPIVGSLREAIVKANSHPGADKIDFQLPGVLVHTIIPVTDLPEITGQLTIDGTDPTHPNTHSVVIDGSKLNAGIGFRISAAGSTVRGLVISNFKSTEGAISINADHVVVANNYIGTDASGAIEASNGSGVTVHGNAAYIDHNVIAGTLGDGIRLSGDNSVVVSNLIGTNATGTAGISNNVGVTIRGNGNHVGNGIASSRNIISGNVNSGVAIRGAAHDNFVQNNVIGLDAIGTKEIKSQQSGVVISDGAKHNTIGGASPTLRNILSGNIHSGVELSGLGTTQNIVSGNFIGVAADGKSRVGNQQIGVEIERGSSSNTIGGNSVGERNVISANQGDGVHIDGTPVTSQNILFEPVHANGNRIIGNLIGTDYTGTKKLANLTNGIEIENGAQNNAVGGGAENSRNVVSANLENQIFIHGSGTDNNSIQGNYVGTDASGLHTFATSESRYTGIGISDGARSNYVGGVLAGSRNVISGNYEGINIQGSQTGANVVNGNFIGVDRTGKTALANGIGVRLAEGAILNSIGRDRGNIISGNETGIVLVGENTHFNGITKNFIGTDENGFTKVANNVGVSIGFGSHDNLLAGNVISGNTQDGVQISDQATVHNRVEGNRIGTDATGVGPLSNGRDGVYINFTANSNSITDNTIAFNKLDGILVGNEGLNAPGGPYNTISRNSIHDNGKVGIDLGPADGATPNGNYNSSATSNFMIDHPVLTSVNRYQAGIPGVFVGGTYYSPASQDITLELFISKPGSNQGTKYVGTSKFHVDANKATTFLSSLPSLNMPNGWVVTATATDAQGNTSEFSSPVTPKVNQVKDKIASTNGNSSQAVMIDVQKAHDLAILEMLSHGDLTNQVPSDLIKQLALA